MHKPGFLYKFSQIDEGVVFRVAGGLLLEHPLTLPFVEAVVSSNVIPIIFVVSQFLINIWRKYSKS